ncbi:unnamed protein product [marine sediment metagenome]|uniref:Uncharacterized protein n=1 Tax=marine sediment metagenome TaxID=412755 RepID=X1H2J7_9ZZZZ
MFFKRQRKENIFREGVIVTLFFVSSAAFLLILNIFLPTFLLIAFSVVFFALAAVVLFMILLIPAIEMKGSQILFYLWNEFLFTFIGIPLASICVLILPVSIYLLFFSGSAAEIIIFAAIFTFSLQITSLIYTGIKLWLSSRISGNKVPVKVDKGPIEQLLSRFPSLED